MFRIIFATLAGAALAYLFDPEKGEDRRKQAQRMLQDKGSTARAKVENFNSPLPSIKRLVESAHLRPKRRRRGFLRIALPGLGVGFLAAALGVWLARRSARSDNSQAEYRSKSETPETHLLSRVTQFDKVWNAHDSEAVIEFFTEDSMVRFNATPPPPDREVWMGKQQIREFVALYTPGFFVVSEDREVRANRVSWAFRARADRFREIGIETSEGTVEAFFLGDLIKSLSISFSKETEAAIRGIGLAHLEGNEPQGDAVAIGHEETPDEANCAHMVLVPRWDSADDMGKPEKASGYRCDGCGRELTLEEGKEVLTSAGAIANHLG